MGLVTWLSPSSRPSACSATPPLVQWGSNGWQREPAETKVIFEHFYSSLPRHPWPPSCGPPSPTSPLPPQAFSALQYCNMHMLTIDGYHVEQNVPVKQFCQMLRHFWRVIPVGKNIQQVGGGGKIEPFKEDWKDKLKREHLGNASLFVSRYSASAFSHFDKLCISSSSFSESPSALVAFTTFGVFAISTMRTLKSLSTMSNRLESSGSWARMSSDPMKIDSR